MATLTLEKPKRRPEKTSPIGKPAPQKSPIQEHHGLPSSNRVGEDKPQNRAVSPKPSGRSGAGLNGRMRGEPGALGAQMAEIFGPSIYRKLDEMFPGKGFEDPLVKKDTAPEEKSKPLPLPKPNPTQTKRPTKTKRRGGPPCDCPNQRDSRNRKCGGRCAMLKPGGRKPKC